MYRLIEARMHWRGHLIKDSILETFQTQRCLYSIELNHILKFVNRLFTMPGMSFMKTINKNRSFKLISTPIKPWTSAIINTIQISDLLSSLTPTIQINNESIIIIITGKRKIKNILIIIGKKEESQSSPLIMPHQKRILYSTCSQHTKLLIYRSPLRKHNVYCSFVELGGNMSPKLYHFGFIRHI